MLKSKFNLVISLFVLCALSLYAEESIYTEIKEKDCKTVMLDQETGSSKQICRGISGFQLAVLDDDARQSLNVITPDGIEHTLDIWTVVTAAFSTLGNKVEWRIHKNDKKKLPFALIVRVQAQENPQAPGKYVSYLAVAKLKENSICIVDKIPPGKKQNELARASADSSHEKKCLK